MGEWINFRELRQKLDFERVFEKYGVRLKARGKQFVGPCPLPGHTGAKSKESFSANREKGVFQCFSCGAKGNILDFCCLMDGGDPERGDDLRNTALALADHLNIGSGGMKPIDAPKSGRETVLVNAPLDFELKGLDPTHEYLRSSGLSEEIIALFGLGFCSRGYLNGRIAIPIHNPRGELVGYGGRLIDDKLVSNEHPRYLLPGTRKRGGVTHEFRKSLLLYNAHRIKFPVNSLVIVEGFRSVWWLTQNGYPNCVATMGSSISAEQVTLALSLVHEDARVILIPDGDTAGKQFAEEAGKLFRGKIDFRLVLLGDGLQPTDLDREALEKLLREPNDKIDDSSPQAAICRLIGEFPCLKSLGIRPETWDAETFDRQALKFSSGELSIAQFILGVWNPRTQWKCGKFDLIEAASRLDEEHRNVIIDWFSDPWWP